MREDVGLCNRTKVFVISRNGGNQKIRSHLSKDVSDTAFRLRNVLAELFPKG